MTSEAMEANFNQEFNLSFKPGLNDLEGCGGQALSNLASMTSEAKEASLYHDYNAISGMTNFNLRRVLNPGLQQPFCPPRPKLPSEAIVLDSSYLTDLARMARQQNYTDLIFLCGTVGFSAHRFMMASASPLLRRILTADYDLHATSGATRSNSETSLVSRN